MRNIDKKYHYLYKTTNLINNKYYYGIHSTNNIDDGYLGSGTYLRRAIRKYGKDNFKREIIKQFDNRDELVNAEQEIITETVIKDKYCMNCQYGGEGFNTIGMVTVKDQNGNTMKTFCDDPRYLSGELFYYSTGFITVKDKNNNMLRVSVNDPRYLSGELKHNITGFVNVLDKNGNILHININDPRYLSGELKHFLTGFVTVKDKNQNILNVKMNDPRYLSGELKHIWKDKKHNNETKNKISKKAKERIGDKNSSFGTCWITRYSEITKDNENKKIKKEELDQYIINGWSKGRKITKIT